MNAISPLLLYSAILCSAFSAQAQSTLTVTTLTDSGAGSLRSALAFASPGDRLILDISGVLTLTSGPLEIDKDLEIRGPGADVFSISGGNTDRVLLVTAGVAVLISDLSIINGKAPNGEHGLSGTDGVAGVNNGDATNGLSGSDGESGGGIYNQGTLTLTRCSLRENHAGNGGWGGRGGSGARLTASKGGNGGNGGHGGLGGGILSTSTLRLIDCAVSDNHAGDGGYGGGGGSSGQGDPNSGGIGGFGGVGGSGGGIHSSGVLELTGSSLALNRAGAGGTGGQNIPPSNQSANAGIGGHGGAILSAGSLTAQTSTFAGNQAGPGGNGGSGGGGQSGGAGGHGGAIHLSAVGLLTQCTLSGNAAASGGAGGTDWDDRTGYGGKGGSGGGIYNGGRSNTQTGSLTLTACTLTGNQVGSGEATNDNNDFGEGGGVSGAATLRNTLIALNSGPAGPDMFGTALSLGYNLIGYVDGGALPGGNDIYSNNGLTGITHNVNHDLVGTVAAPIDPELGLLADNGGATRTHAVLPASPARDVGDSTLMGSPALLAGDQRGAPRSAGAGVDIGAFELTSQEAWRHLYFGAVDNTGDRADSFDFDNDGSVNLLEYAFGTDPRVFGNSTLTVESAVEVTRGEPRYTWTRGENGLELGLVFMRRIDFAAAGLVYQVQSSYDLILWTNVTMSPLQLGIDDEMEAVEVTYPELNPSPPSAHFFRIRVSSTTPGS